MTTFSTASRAHLRRAGPDGPGRAREAGREQSRGGVSDQGDPSRWPGFTPGLSPLRGGSFSPRPSDASPTARRAAAHGYPGDRPPSSPPYPAAAPASPGQAVNIAPGEPGAGEDATATGTERRALSRSAPPPARAPEDPFRSAQNAPQKASSGPTPARGATADPAGLTARARPRPGPTGARRTSSRREPGTLSEGW